jgi:long-chain acyl-CoA synthetase
MIAKPSIIIVSDATQLKKINTIIKKHSFIKKVISFENIKDKNVTFIDENF